MIKNKKRKKKKKEKSAPWKIKPNLPQGVNALSISGSELWLPVIAPGLGAGEAAPMVLGCV